MTDRLLTPSKITAWLDCAHFLGLKHKVEDGVLPEPGGNFGAFARLLADKGLQHEADCLASYEAAGKSVLRVPERLRSEAFAAWVARVGESFDEGYDVIYQMPFVHDGVRGIADFLVKDVGADGTVTYEPVDAKLARAEAKPGHVLQLCFYADAIEEATGHRPKRMHLWLGSGNVESLVVDEFSPYWRRIKTQLTDVLSAEEPAGTTPEPCNHCAFCEFFDVCTADWRRADSLMYVAGLRALDKQLLEAAGVSSLAALAARPATAPGINAERLSRLVDQAALQAQARLVDEDASPPFRMIDAGDDPLWGRGFELLPRPDDGDVFLDFEGHPFWRPDCGLFFLFGLIARDDADAWAYNEWWAHDVAGEAAAVAGLVDFLDARRRSHPGMHIYHYNHTERSSLERLTRDHRVREAALGEMVATGRFVDLLAVARNAIQVGTESYGLKSLERLTDYERGHDIDAGAGAVVGYERFMASRDPAELTAIAAYNEDDVRATRALRDWLVANRPDGLSWRETELTPDEGTPDLDAQVAALHEYDEDSAEHLLGDVLGYWRREWLAHLAPRPVLSQSDPTILLDEPEAIAGLVPTGLVERYGAKGQVLKVPAMRFSFPEQNVEAFDGDDKAIYLTPEGAPAYAQIDRLDVDAGTVDLLWSEPEDGQPRAIPAVLVHSDWVSPRPKPTALSELAARLLEPGGAAPSPVSMALVRRDLPVFVPGGGPPGGRFTDDLDEMTRWASQLDGTVVAIQGPPGTGKTFRAAHLVLALLRADLRVGITAFSHYAIDNVLDEVIRVFTEHGELSRLHAVRRGVTPAAGALPNVTYVGSNGPCCKSEFNLVAGTTWLFAGNDMYTAPVDVLLVDEAGQLALADALAASRSARNLVLLGDPLQLPQVAQAVHPDGSGRSVLEHVLGDGVTMPPERGVFISQTRRMHPDVCSFISEEIYEGRLSWTESCERQTTEAGTGLRWLRANHAGRTTEAPEEAELVAAEIERLVGTAWTNQDGLSQPLAVTDFMVVAPFNNQVDLIRSRLDQNARTRGVPVGTVDKFQGRQAAVVFFTMTTSSGADITRGADFLFSRNRLNVAVSRARCLAYLVCTEELMNSRARDVNEMRLLSTLCAFVEHTRRA